MKNYFLFILFFTASNLFAQEIEFDSLEVIYQRLNTGKLLPDDRQSLEQLKSYENDSLVIHKTFTDINGKNQLEIKVANPCCLADDNYRVDGMINYITVRLNNKKYSDTLTYYNPNVLMSLMYLVEKNITLKSLAGKQAVFIPFSYCANADDEIRIAYIVFYDHKKYFYHINLLGHEFSDYKINDNLDEKLNILPPLLKKELIALIRSQYKAVI